MSYAIFILFALFIKQINNLPITKGELGLNVTFWGFGVLGSLLLYGASIWFFSGKIDGSILNYQVNSAITTTLSIWPIYSYVVLRGIWSASKNSVLLKKLASRYFSIFFITIIVGCAFFLKFQYVVALVIILIMRNKKVTTNSAP